MFKIGQTVVVSDKNNFYNGKSVVVKSVTNYGSTVVYTVEYNCNVTFAVRENHLGEI